MIRTISFGGETYHTLDNYDGSTRNDKDEMNDLWKDEEELYFAGIPEALWHEEEWIELLADQVEISRLLDMKVLVTNEVDAKKPLCSKRICCGSP